MRHFNNFTKDKGDNQPEVMKEFKISFKGHKLKIQFICIFKKCPEYFFYILSPKKMACLMSKGTIMGKLFWNSRLSQEDSQELADLIEQQTGIILPEKQSNNPFEYKGDIRVRMYVHDAPGFILLKAKEPFGKNMYYKISFPDESYTFGYFHWPWCPDGRWETVEPLMDAEKLEPFISLVNACEKNCVWRTEDDK